MGSEHHLRLERHGSVATIWLDRLDKRNAMNYDMWVALGEACRHCSNDAATRVVVLRSRGDHFCAGADLVDLRAERPATMPSFMEVNGAAEDALATVARPTIAAIDGDCVGGGTALAIDCDLRIATASARFGITPARLGIAYPPASVERATRLLGPGAATWLLFTGELIDASEALRIGLVHEVVPDRDALDQRVDALSTLLAERSLLSQLAAKRMIADVVATGRVTPSVAEEWARAVAGADDPAEGIAAFVERRRAAFTWTP